MSFKNLLCVAAAGCWLAVSPANAATVFNMNEVIGGSTTASLSEGGIDLTITSTGGNIHRNGSGIGVNGPSDVSNLLEAGEALSFSFDPAVQLLESVVFEVGGGVDTISIFDFGGALLTSFDVLSANNQNTFFTKDLTGITGSFFRFESTSAAGAGNPGVRISSLEVAAIPLPASAVLLFAGIGALGFAARRKTSRNA